MSEDPYATIKVTFDDLPEDIRSVLVATYVLIVTVTIFLFFRMMNESWGNYLRYKSTYNPVRYESF